MRRLANVFLFAALAATCAAQGCYEFSGSGITLDINVVTITYMYGPTGGETVYNFSGTDSVTLNGSTTNWSESGSQGSVNIQYENDGVGYFTTFQMIVPDSTGKLNYTVLLGGTGNAIPGDLLPSPQNLPPISAWTGVSNSNTITYGSGKSAITYNITSLGACSTVPNALTTPTSPTTPPSTPTITAVQDAGSYTAQIAQGSVFVVKGTDLSGSGYTAESYPLPTSDQGVSINFTPSEGGTAIQAYLVYLYNESGVNQLAAILPSSTPTGTYKVTVVTPSGTSASVNVTVVATKPELITQDSSGSGLVVVQNYVSATELDVNRFTTGVIAGGITISPAHPGQTEIAWLTGMGGVTTGDNNACPGYNFAANGVSVQVIVGGLGIPVSYAGRAPDLCGTDQIDFTLPSNTPTGCTVPFTVDEDGVLSKTTFISIAPAGSQVCSLTGYTTAQLQDLDNGAVITYGGMSITDSVNGGPNISTTSDFTAQGGFLAYSGFEIVGLPAPGTPSPGCTVTQFVGAQTASGVGRLLDAGTLTLTGPSSSGLNNTPLVVTGNTYYTAFQGLPPGTYTLNGSGGADVGKFTTSVVIPTQLEVTNFPSEIDRSADLVLNYTGGDSGDLIPVIGEAFTYAAQSAPASGAIFSCYYTVGSGSITVPASVLAQMPAINLGQIENATGYGSLDVTWAMTPPNSTLIVAPLTSGGTTNTGYLLGGNYIDFSLPYE